MKDNSTQLGSSTLTLNSGRVNGHSQEGKKSSKIAETKAEESNAFAFENEKVRRRYSFDDNGGGYLGL